MTHRESKIAVDLPSFWRWVLRGMQKRPPRERREFVSITEAYARLEASAIAHNERILSGNLDAWTHYNGRHSDSLIPHPTIRCRWDACPHRGAKNAVWLRNMDDPTGRECSTCLVEDPYE